MGGKRQKNRSDQPELAFAEEARGEAPRAEAKGTEPTTATSVPQSPVVTEKLMEGILRTSNLLEAFRRVRANKGSPGIDGMTVEEVQDYYRQNWPILEGLLLRGTYQP